MKLYHYVGPEDIHRRAAHAPPGARLDSASALVDWLRCHAGQLQRERLHAVTFVVAAAGQLCLADRGSEHVACAGGEPVLAAGEMFLLATADGVRVEEISNQSTGYCPEPESWPAVAAALDRLGLPHPGRFTQAVIFRRCPACGQRNLVKDSWFFCGMCGADLPVAWNF